LATRGRFNLGREGRQFRLGSGGPRFGLSQTAVAAGLVVAQT
jgi:hypothetical protein